jgi:hypothetical protein
VTPHARIKFDGNRYSVPADLARETVMIRADATQLRIFHQGCEVARHDRCHERGQLVIQTVHQLDALNKRRRVRAHHVEEMFDALGPLAQAFHIQLCQRPVKTVVHLRRVLRLVRLYGRQEVLAAIAQALKYQTYDAAYVETILLQERRRRELPSPTPLCLERRELIEEIELDEPDPGDYDRFCAGDEETESDA